MSGVQKDAAAPVLLGMNAVRRQHLDPDRETCPWVGASAFHNAHGNVPALKVRVTENPCGGDRVVAAPIADRTIAPGK